ncbi:hypothetical protein [Haloferula sp.]|uniref:hypothetical protein n=1 Tax=Haloferula sp. TaxID=2497595 RepID=UPI003C72C346
MPSQPLAFLIFVLALVSRCHAVVSEVQATFFIQESSITALELSRPLAMDPDASKTRTYSGQFTGTLGLDLDSLIPKNFTFTGGNIEGSGYTLDFSAFVRYGDGSEINSYFFRTTGIGDAPSPTKFTPTTLTPPGIVGDDGFLTIFQQRLFGESGILVTGRSVRGVLQNRTITNYEATATSFPFPGPAKLTLESISRTRTSQRLRAILEIEVDDLEVIDLPGANTSLLDTQMVFSERGTITARTSMITVPTAYGRWASKYKLGDPDPETLNSFGIAYGMLFALDLPVTTGALPVSIVKTSTGPLAKISLPETGLGLPMSVQYKRKLSDPTWLTLPKSYYRDGPTSLDPGATGEPRVGFPNRATGFIRFVVDIPAD